MSNGPSANWMRLSRSLPILCSRSRKMTLNILKNANLTLALFLEIGVLEALADWGVSTGQGTLAKIALGIGARALAIVVWGCFGAPRAPWCLRGVQFFILRVLFFGSAVVA